MSKGFASTTDVGEKKIAFDAIGPGLYAFTAEGDPNSGVIVGDDSVMIVDAQATPVMAREVIERVAKVTDKPIKYVLLTHYHAVRVLGASAYAGAAIIASDTTRGLIAERGRQDMDSEIGRFPRLFRAVETIPGLTWPSVTFPDQMSVWLGQREVRIMHIGRGHTAGDVIAWVPDAGVVFSGDLVEYRSACYCGDAHFTDWPATLDRLAEFQAKALVPGRGVALKAPRDGGRRHRDDGGFPDHALRLGSRQRRHGPVAQGSVRHRPRRHGSEIFRLRNLRALPAVQRFACLRRSARHRPPRHLDGRARPRNVGSAPGVTRSRGCEVAAGAVRVTLSARRPVKSGAVAMER